MQGADCDHCVIESSRVRMLRWFAVADQSRGQVGSALYFS